MRASVMRLAVVFFIASSLGTAARVCGSYLDDDLSGVAIEWIYSDTEQMDTHGDGRKLLVYGAPGRAGFFIRATVNNNVRNTCSRFWALSQPGGTRNPSKAYRRATRNQVNQVTSDMSLDGGRLRTLRMICRETRFIGKSIQRKVLRVEAIAAIAPERQAEYNSRMLSYVRRGTWLREVCATLGNALRDLDRWCPQRAEPVNPP